MCIRDHFLGAFGAYCIVVGVLIVAVGLFHLVLWLFIFRKEELIEAQAAASVPEIVALDRYHEGSEAEAATLTGKGSASFLPSAPAAEPPKSPDVFVADTQAAQEREARESVRRAMQEGLRRQAEAEARRQVEEEERQIAEELAHRRQVQLMEEQQEREKLLKQQEQQQQWRRAETVAPSAPVHRGGYAALDDGFDEPVVQAPIRTPSAAARPPPPPPASQQPQSRGYHGMDDPDFDSFDQ